MYDSTGITTYSHDALANPLSVATTYTSVPTKTVSYTYSFGSMRAGMGCNESLTPFYASLRISSNMLICLPAFASTTIQHSAAYCHIFFT